MASTFTPNIQLNEPARNDDVGTWDTPVNSNMTLIDLVVGGIATIALNNSPVVLSAAQFQASTITFNSTLTGSVAITFPTSFTKPYTVGHLCTGSSAFVITLGTTATGGQVICCPPGEFIECFNDGANLKFKNLGRIGAYWDYAGSSIPAWVSGCTVPPYLNCDGTTFSGTTYPTLAVIFGGTTLPDGRGRTRFTLNQTIGRITSSQSGLDGNTLFASGGDQLAQAHSHSITDPGHNHSFNNNPVFTGQTSGNSGSGGAAPGGVQQTTILSNTTGISVNTALSGTGQNIPPAYVGGLTLVRAG